MKSTGLKPGDLLPCGHHYWTAPPFGPRMPWDDTDICGTCEMDLRDALKAGEGR